MTVAPALSEDKKPKTLTPQEQAQFSSQARLAAGLAALGESEKDPDLLVSAAKIIEGLGKGTKLKTEKQGTLTAKSLLDQAKELGASEASLATVAKKRSSMSPRDWACDYYEICDYYYCYWYEDCYYW
ncbi:MAG: hypothetical protein AAF405_06175 [Pseudomonadota bacterium]